MQEICPSSLMSGIWKRRHGQIIRHRQPKGSETVKAEPTSTASDLDSTLSRGFSRRPARHRNPLQILPRINTCLPSKAFLIFCLTMSNGRARRVRVDGLIIGGASTCRGDAESPGSGGASPSFAGQPDKHRFGPEPHLTYARFRVSSRSLTLTGR